MNASVGNFIKAFVERSDDTEIPDNGNIVTGRMQTHYVKLSGLIFISSIFAVINGIKTSFNQHVWIRARQM